MLDKDKDKEQLIGELADLRHRIAELEASVAADRQTEESLRKAEASWRSLVENAPEKITSLDRDGTILFINRTTLGHTVEQVVHLVGRLQSRSDTEGTTESSLM